MLPSRKSAGADDALPTQPAFSVLYHMRMKAAQKKHTFSSAADKFGKERKLMLFISSEL